MTPFEALAEPNRRNILDPAFNQLWHAEGIEMGFDLFLQAVHAKALVDSLVGRERRW